MLLFNFLIASLDRVLVVQAVFAEAVGRVAAAFVHGLDVVQAHQIWVGFVQLVELFLELVFYFVLLHRLLFVGRVVRAVSSPLLKRSQTVVLFVLQAVLVTFLHLLVQSMIRARSTF